MKTSIYSRITLLMFAYFPGGFTPVFSQDCIQDRNALIAFYNAMGGDDWRTRDGWLTTSPVGEWFGVTTNGDGCVTKLEFEGNGLNGFIPPDIGLLTELIVLDITSTSLTNSSIPIELGQLTNLEELNLSHNSLMGSIPSSLNTLSNLKKLDLEDNELTGSIPSNLGDLSNLIFLDLGRNMLTGTIPSKLGDLGNLTGLTLGQNNLSGNIPNALKKLKKLNRLSLRTNQLTGPIPIDLLTELKNLTTLFLFTNQLSGSIPSEIKHLKKLQYLNIGNNLFTGEIPIELTTLSNLINLNIFTTQITGTIPDGFGNLSNLQKLDLVDNQLYGCIPNDLKIYCDKEGFFLGIDKNPGLPWQGDIIPFCNMEVQIGATCDDGDPNTENDQITENCECLGTPITCSAGDINAGADRTLTCLNRSIQLNADQLPMISAYEWTTQNGNILSGATTASPIINQTGTYSLQITDANGCTAIDEIVITEDLTIPVAIAGNNQELNCQVLNLTLDASQSEQAIAYTWSTNNGRFVSTDLDQQTVIIDAPGSYSLQVTAANGCTATDEIEVISNTEAPVLVIETPPIITCLQPIISLNASNSQGAEIYQWSTIDGTILTNSNTPEISVNQAGIYNLIITATNGCTATNEITIASDIESPLVVIDPPDTITCLTTSLQLNASSVQNGLSYQWSTTDGNILLGANSITPTINQAGTYELLISSENGCTTTDSITVPSDVAIPIANAGGNQVLNCEQNVIMLDGRQSEQARTFQWSSNNGRFVSEADLQAQMVTVEEAGIYTLLITADNGCTASDQIEVIEDQSPPIAELGVDRTLTCIQTNLSLSPTDVLNTNSYQWFTIGGNIPTNNNTAEINIDQAGRYSLTVTAANGCTATDEIEIISDTEAPILVMETPAIITCLQPSISLDARNSQEAEIYQWTTSDGNIMQGTNTATPTIDEAGTYQLLITASNGCTATEEVLVIADQLAPIANVGNDQTLNCHQPIIALDGSQSEQAIAYNWTTNGGRFVSRSDRQQPRINIDAPGIYTLEVTAANGCTANSSLIVTAILPPENPNLLFSPISCQDEMDGQITVQNVEGGAPPFLYALNESDYQANNQFDTLSAGTYRIRIKDQNDCELSTEMTLDNPAALMLNLEQSTETNICLGDPIQLDACAANFQGDLLFNWSGGESILQEDGLDCSALTVSPITNTFYFLEIMDEMGCTAKDSLIVTVTAFGENEFVLTPDDDTGMPMLTIPCAVSNNNEQRREKNSIIIFNRWGQKIFEASPYQNDWNGTNENGNPIPQGTYFFILRLNIAEGEVIHGSILVLR